MYMLLTLAEMLHLVLIVVALIMLIRQLAYLAANRDSFTALPTGHCFSIAPGCEVAHCTFMPVCTWYLQISAAFSLQAANFNIAVAHSGCKLSHVTLFMHLLQLAHAICVNQAGHL